MNREDIKTILSKKGVNEKMLEMPAIIEPLYKRFMNSPKSELENEEVKVDEKGGFTYLGKIYSVKDEGVQIDIPGEDATVQVNKYGIETSYYDGSWMGFFSRISRENGEVVDSGGNNGNGSYGQNTFLDNGAYSISYAKGIEVYEPEDTLRDEEKIEELDTAKLDERTILTEFDEISGPIIANYPQTAEWYEQARAALEARLARQNDPEARIERKIARLEAKINSQTEKISRLQEKNEKLTGMLEKSLDFMEDVRRSPVGKMFFGKKLRKYEEDKKSLSSGR